MRSCPLCGGPATVTHPALEGYQAGRSFEITRCGACGAGTAWPLETDPALYDLIYSRRDRIPGYRRYADYLRTIPRAERPLETLADAEESYWAVAEAVRRRRPRRVLDVGSGLGYLTYALHREGLEAVGLEQSGAAREQARAAFGDLFTAGPIGALDGLFDLVLLVQMLEHVPDPKAVLAEAAARVAPGGALLVATPNRSLHPAAAVWDTDLPPVHLWWFTEEAVVRLAQVLGWSAELMDFSPYHEGHYVRVRKAAGAPPRPVLGADGDIRAAAGLKAWAGRSSLVLRLTDPFRGFRRVRGPRGTQIAALLTRPG